MVSHIRYVFQGSDLFGNEDPEIYDETASIERYAELCREKLAQIYPTASVEIFDRGQTWDALLETEVDGTTDSEEVETVKNLCTEVYSRFEWIVERPFLNLSQVEKQIHLPIPVLRWLCQERIILAYNVDGILKIPRETFLGSKDSLLSVCSRLDKTSGLICCDYEEVHIVDTIQFLPGTRVLVSALDDLELPLFNSCNSVLLIRWVDDKTVELIFEHFADKIPWIVEQWAYDTYVQALIEQAQQYPAVKIASTTCQVGRQNYTESVSFRFNYPLVRNRFISELIEQAKATIKLIIQDAEVVLQGGPTWHQKYEIKGNEEEFCREVLEPLLHKMGFERIRYIHGNDEYGRDFILAEQTRWGWPQYYGIQVKAGDVSGGATSDIDKILGQIEDALAMPYHSQNAEEIFITSFIVAISGHFKKNAKEKIIEKIPRRDWRGSVRFLAQDDIRDLIRQHWLTSFAKR